MTSWKRSARSWTDTQTELPRSRIPWVVRHRGYETPAEHIGTCFLGPRHSLAIALIDALHVDQGIHYFATWSGYGTEFPGPTVVFSPYQREMVLYSGPLLDGDRLPLVPTTVIGRVPMYWWPSDLRWFVGQDIYARSLIVGCDQSTAQTILAAPNLDAYPINPSDIVLIEEF